MKWNPPRHPAVWAATIVIVVVGLAGTVLSVLGQDRDVARTLVGFVVVTYWVPTVLRHRLES